MILIGPIWRHAMLASLVSSATPKAPFIPPVCARLMWQATPSTLGSSKPSTTILSLGPRSRNLVLTEPVVPRSGRLMTHTLNRTTTSTTAVPRMRPSLLTISYPLLEEWRHLFRWPGTSLGLRSHPLHIRQLG